MGKVNVGRVILGGLLAGLIINIGEYLLNERVLGAEMEAALQNLGLAPPGGSAIGVFVLMGFILGIATVWLYAAIRPRYGAGPKTAITTGLTVWFLAYLWGSVGFVVMGMFPANLVLFALVWGLVEIVLASLAGAWVYKEA
jgi:hypothetical protein